MVTVTDQGMVVYKAEKQHCRAFPVYANTPWESIEALIAAWKNVRDYPLAL